MDAINGTERTLNVNSYSSCGTCKGTGDKPGSKQSQCTQCRGSGFVSSLPITRP
jgi:molecular chaperone DnaJ